MDDDKIGGAQMIDNKDNILLDATIEVTDFEDVTDKETGAEAEEVFSVPEEDDILSEPSDIPNTEEDSVSVGIGTVLKRFFALAMCAVSVVFLVITVGYFISRHDFSSNSVASSLLAFMTGRDVFAVIPEKESENVSEEAVESEHASDAEDESADISDERELELKNIEITLSNETPYEVDMAELLESDRIIPTLDALYGEFGDDAPIVLILHTHATEGYSDTEEDGYRTDDTSRNMIGIGKAVADVLEEYGINVIHSVELFDEPDFSMAYYSASLEIKSQLKENPSISYIIDIHRDSILDAEGEYYAPTAILNFGEKKTEAAQMMFVIGTDHGGSGHVNWRDNLSLATRLQCRIEGEHSGLMRGINLRSASFNEQYTSGSLLLEVGSCASEYDEALVSAEIFAEALALEIIG